MTRNSHNKTYVEPANRVGLAFIDELLECLLVSATNEFLVLLRNGYELGFVEGVTRRLIHNRDRVDLILCDNDCERAFGGQIVM